MLLEKKGHPNQPSYPTINPGSYRNDWFDKMCPLLQWWQWCYGSNPSHFIGFKVFSTRQTASLIPPTDQKPWRWLCHCHKGEPNIILLNGHNNTYGEIHHNVYTLHFWLFVMLCFHDLLLFRLGQRRYHFVKPNWNDFSWILSESLSPTV